MSGLVNNVNNNTSIPDYHSVTGLSADIGQPYEARIWASSVRMGCAGTFRDFATRGLPNNIFTQANAPQIGWVNFARKVLGNATVEEILRGEKLTDDEYLHSFSPNITVFLLILFFKWGRADLSRGIKISIRFKGANTFLEDMMI